MTTVTKLLACGTGNMCRSCGKTIFVLTVWFIPAPSQGRTLAERSMSKASVNDRTEF